MTSNLIEVKSKKSSYFSNIFGYDTFHSFLTNYPSFDSFYVDTTKFPIILKWLTFVSLNLFFLIMFITFIHKEYVMNLNHSFLSDDPSSGNCSVLGIYLL